MIVGDGNARETTGVWAHVVGVGHPEALVTWPIFFDPNQGQFSWQKNNPEIGQDVMNNLDATYVQSAGLNIRNYVIYEFDSK